MVHKSSDRGQASRKLNNKERRRLWLDSGEWKRGWRVDGGWMTDGGGSFRCFRPSEKREPMTNPTVYTVRVLDL